MSEYVKMHQFLKEEEQLHVQLLEKEERENLKKLRDNEIKLTQQVRGLSKMIGQIESMCQNSSTASLEVRTLGQLMEKYVVTHNISSHTRYNVLY